MTCIVGLKYNDKVYMGADSAGVAGLDIYIRKDPKIFEVGDFIIGCTTSYRMIQLLMFSFKPPEIKPDIDMYEYMCTGFIESIRKLFKRKGYAKIESNEEEGGTFIVAYKDRMFIVQGDYQVAEYANDMAAVGCGDNYALGSLHTSMKLSKGDIKPKQIIKDALSAAAHFSAGVSKPFIIKNT